MYRGTFIYIFRNGKKKRKIWQTDENAMNDSTKRREKGNKDLGKDFCLFVCLLVLRDSSQAQKLCSFLLVDLSQSLSLALTQLYSIALIH